jgi:peptidoglycan hydrolase-like protein with peptidoglycan-binding domain
VRQVQQALVRNGFPSTVDGFFGPKTEEAVKAFQQQKQLQPVDGIVGPATLAALGLSSS